MANLKLQKIKSKKILNEEIRLSKNDKTNEKIKFMLNHFIFPSIAYKHFTNYFKNEEHYITEMSNIYRKIIPWVEDKNFIELEKENKHCHIIKSETKEYRFIKDILQKYYEKIPKLKTSLDEEGDDESFYQISSQSGTRLIGKRVGDIFYLLFIDCYHLVYMNDIFNEDYNNYTYTPNPYMENIKIISFNDVLEQCEECLLCDALEKITR